MGSAAVSIISMLTAPWEQFMYYVANDCTVHSQCGGNDACCTCDCETEGQQPMEGGETQVEMGACCFLRHRD